jgi:dihydrofolate synthase/folylpolyglutamate synthase
VPVITATDAPEALAVIQQTAARNGSGLTQVGAADLSRPPLDTLHLPLLGDHQRLNAAVALATVRVLASQLPLNPAAIREGLSQVHWSGRLQRIVRPSGQVLLLDGAHNPGGAETLAAALRQHFPGARPTLVLGILRDKDWAAICDLLAPLAGRILLVPVHSDRSAEPHGLAEVCHRANPRAEVLEFPSLAPALRATAGDPFVTIAGSLYLVGEAMELLALSPNNGAGERGLNEWESSRPAASSPCC